MVWGLTSSPKSSCYSDILDTLGGTSFPVSKNDINAAKKGEVHNEMFSPKFVVEEFNLINKFGMNWSNNCKPGLQRQYRTSLIRLWQPGFPKKCWLLWGTLKGLLELARRGFNNILFLQSSTFCLRLKCRIIKKFGKYTYLLSCRGRIHLTPVC